MKLLYTYVQKIQLINPGIQYCIGVLLFYWINRCLPFMLIDFSQNRQNISNWYYYPIPDIVTKRIKVGVIDVLNFKINQLSTIWQVHIVILDTTIKKTVLNFIGISFAVERLLVITNPRFKRLHKYLNPLLHLERGKTGLRNGNNQRPWNVFSILKDKMGNNYCPTWWAVQIQRKGRFVGESSSNYQHHRNHLNGTYSDISKV